MSFDPYEQSGGTVVAISGEGFCVVAADTRQSSGYLINTRKDRKIAHIGGHTAVSGSGFSGDVREVAKRLRQENEVYKFSNGREMSCQTLAQFTMTHLYSRRFFPLYTFGLVCGLGADGHGAVFTFDPVGSYEREEYRAVGTGAKLVQSLLDSVVGNKNRSTPKRRLGADEAVQLCLDGLVAACTRDILTGDAAEVHVITSGGICTTEHALCRD
ncbi:MAG: 20S proteasome subunit beta 6, PSMB1 [Amphiamblys sp. WSBS2006]|nr:MAG: 20S proteasome subunit beta 6, PSMB1 [Amphiamblys sp. WSBS2006]